LAVLVLWLAITAFIGFDPGAEPGIDNLLRGVTDGIGWPYVAAVVFLATVVVVFRWTDLGFNPPQPPGSIWVTGIPAVFIGLFALLTLALGFPPAPAVAFVLLNTLLVGISEETMFRGILLRAFLSRMRFWPSIWLTSILFGGIHVLNGFATGSFVGGLVQAVAAFMTGLMLLGLLLNTRSLLVPIAVHWLWDATLLLLLTAVIAYTGEQPEIPAEPSAPLLVGPVLFATPNFLYGLYLVRRAARNSLP
jgi:membrane protease YdiL (CAAX protease family)